MEKELNAILENIEAIRMEKNISQTALALKIGIQQSSINLILSGKRALKYKTLLQIAKALEVSVVDIIVYPRRYINPKNRKERRRF